MPDSGHDPLVSIITPSLNQGEFIRDCIESVRDQTYVNIEHIIIDGLSKDDTIDVIKSHEGTYNMVWKSERDTGQANAINKGFDMARGEIVCWLNCDDFYLNNDVIRLVVEEFKRNPKIDVVVGDAYYCNRSGSLTLMKVLKPNFITLGKMLHGDHIVQPSSFWRHTDLRLREDCHYTFDWRFYVDMMRMGKAFLYVRQFLSVYRLYEDNKTSLDNSKRKREIYRVVRDNAGKGDPNTIWCYTVYLLYLLSERTGLGFIRGITSRVNNLIGLVTKCRIHSC